MTIAQLSLTGSAALSDTLPEVSTAEALRQSEAKFHSYVEYAPIAILVADNERHFIDSNPAAVRLFGYDAATLAGMHFLDLIPDEDREAVLGDLTTLTHAGRLEGEYRLKKKDGTLTWVLLYAVTLADGRTLAYC
jgi:PAS domain S-box-containing protein